MGLKQPPRRARLSRKKREYKQKLFGVKIAEANATLGSMNWEVPSTEDLLTNDLSKFVHFAASDCGYCGSIKDTVVNWLHPLLLAAKANKN